MKKIFLVFTSVSVLTHFTLCPQIFPDIDKKVTHLHLQAISSSFTRDIRIPVIHENGFIFIQTDKPLYTPEQPGECIEDRE